MSTDEERPTKLQFRAAMEAQDLPAIVNTFEPDAVLRSPITDKLSFTGQEQISAILEVIVDVFNALHFTDEIRTEDAGFLVARAAIDGQDIEWCDHLRLGPDGKIRELTVFVRPLPATAVALRVIGAGLGRRKGPIRARIISVLTRPLGFMARTGDGIGVRLLRPTL
jgi:SnoaL-like domain